MDSVVPGSRGTRALLPPGDLKGYPRSTARATWRAHDGGRCPWWFASDPGHPDSGGRFDLPAPDGTVYVGTSASVAVRERLGKEVSHGWIADDALWRATAVSRLDPGDRPRARGRLANVKAKSAANFHTSELNDVTPYGISRAYAVAFHDHGMTGVRYRARFSMGDRDVAEAWFGPAGAPSPALPASLVPREEWEDLVGLRVVPATLDAAVLRLED